MDIQEKQAKWKQERPLFEAAFIHSHLLLFFNLNENTGDYEIKSEFAEDEDRKLAYEILNTGWAMWLRAKRDAKAQAVQEWKDYELEKPNDGQKCLVIFESKDCEDAQRWMCVDEFNEGMFDFIANWEDQCASVALPAGSIISKVRAVCWATTNLSNAPLSFDRFYEAQEPAND